MPILRSTRVVLPDGVRPASIHVEGGRIARIDEDARQRGSRLIDVGDLVISPGVVDTHVHVNEPGRTDWEGFDTATRAAASGGVTTVVDMPLNSVPATTTVAALDEKRAAARGRAHVEVAFWGGVVPGNARDLDALVDAGVRGFKCFLAPSGVDEFPHVNERDLRDALPTIAKRGVPLLVHAEDPTCLTRPISPAYQTYLASRPSQAELSAASLMIRLAHEFDVHVHIVHVSSAEAVEAIASAKAEGVRITAETCPHYLTFAAGDIPAGATQFKCAPPIRESRHRDALWDGLQSGALDLVASDHSPAPPATKCGGDFTTAWGGIASLELSLAATFTELDVVRRLQPGDGATDAADLRRIARWLSEAPATLAGLDSRKGRIAEGYDADLVVWDPDAEWMVEPSRLQQRHKLTPYAGRRLRGVVHETYVRGERVWQNGVLSRPCVGDLL